MSVQRLLQEQISGWNSSCRMWCPPIQQELCHFLVMGIWVFLPALKKFFKVWTTLSAAPSHPQFSHSVCRAVASDTWEVLRITWQTGSHYPMSILLEGCSEQMACIAHPVFSLPCSCTSCRFHLYPLTGVAVHCRQLHHSLHTLRKPMCALSHAKAKGEVGLGLVGFDDLHKQCSSSVPSP